jgi:hypothetical protein
VGGLARAGIAQDNKAPAPALGRLTKGLDERYVERAMCRLQPFVCFGGVGKDRLARGPQVYVGL